MRTYALVDIRALLNAGMYLFIGLLMLICSTGSLAESVNFDIEVTEQGGVYHIKATTVIDVPAEYVRQVLSDFDHIYRLNPSIIESKVLPDEDITVTYVRTRVLGCAGYFCQELERVEKVRKLASGDLLAEIVPDESEFKSGRTVWHIEGMDARSRVVYESSMEPDFYIPPVIGKFLAKKSIRTEIAASFQNLERIALVLAERDWVSDFRLMRLQSLVSIPCDLAAQ